MAPNPTIAKWLMQHIHYTLVESAVDWMSSEQHSCGHLLQVDLPEATSHALAVAYADFRPQHVRWRLPLRLAAGCRALAPNSTFLDLLHLDDDEFSRQVVALSRSQDAHQARLAQRRIWSWII